ncbi:hypothetical protein LR48_Vigan07g113400 [Vigna angularis]|uniref:Uncharacterized protein n=1 Tax=Phaseolus angularis TaxID=3914 RepID=A0A0L9UX51_PHAAN|nr:hypothetical protein LR48_Vigan07g113400 [Vigna angularis]
MTLRFSPEQDSDRERGGPSGDHFKPYAKRAIRPVGQTSKTVDWRQQLKAHECLVNEVNPFVWRRSVRRARGEGPIGRGAVLPGGGSRSFPRSHSAETQLISHAKIGVWWWCGGA